MKFRKKFVNIDSGWFTPREQKRQLEAIFRASFAIT